MEEIFTLVHKQQRKTRLSAQRTPYLLLWKTDTHLRNPNKLLSDLQYSDPIAEAEAAGSDFPASTKELLQQAIIAVSQLNPDDEVVEQGDEEKDEERDEYLDVDGERLI